MTKMKNAEINTCLQELSRESFCPKTSFDEAKKSMVVVCHDLETGGAPLVLLSLLEFVKDEYECFVIAPGDGTLRSRFTEKEFPVYINSPAAFDREEFRTILSGVDLYLCNTVTTDCFVKFAVGLSTPTLWWIHESKEYFDYYRSYLHPRFCVAPNVKAASVCKKSVPDVAEELRMPCVELSVGVNDCFTGKKEKESEKLRFFMPANFLYIKGHDLVRDAILQLPKEYLDACEFTFAGKKDDSDVASYELIRTLAKDYENVTLLDYISREEVILRLEQTDAVLVPSRIDSLSATAIEGMMMECVCILSDSVGVSAYVTDEEDGLIFPMENAKELAKRICYLVDHRKELPRLQKKSREVYLNNFTKEKCLESFHACVEELEKVCRRNKSQAEVKLTVFTPLYNRKEEVKRLYESLKKQTESDFEWLVIDDGSTDSPEEFFEALQKVNPAFSVVYKKQPNGGKHRAWNRALEDAKGEYFVVCDSDDYFTENAFAYIFQWLDEIKEDPSLYGVAGQKVSPEGGYLLWKEEEDGTVSLYGGRPDFKEPLEANFYDILKHGMRGDRCEVLETDLLRKYPFPEFEGENFLTEGVLYNRLIRDGIRLRWYTDPLEVCEYRNDGLTQSGLQKFLKNPKGYAVYIREDSCSEEERENSFFDYYIRLKDTLDENEIIENLGLRDKGELRELLLRYAKRRQGELALMEEVLNTRCNLMRAGEALYVQMLPQLKQLIATGLHKQGEGNFLLEEDENRARAMIAEKKEELSRDILGVSA